MRKLSKQPWGLFIFVTLVYLFLYAPIIHVIINPFNNNRSLVGWGGFTFDWFSIWTHPAVLEGTKNSSIIAILVTLLSVILGTSSAIAVQKAPVWIRRSMDALTYARIIMPELVLSISLLLFLSAIRIPRGILGVIIGHTVWSSAYVTIIVAARLAGRNPYLDEAGRDLGATRFRVFWRVTLPDIMPAVITGGFLVFVFSFEDVVTSYFLSGDLNTLPVVILSLIRYGVSPGVNAIGAAMMGVSALFLIPYLIINLRTMARTT